VVYAAHAFEVAEGVRRVTGPATFL